MIDTDSVKASMASMGWFFVNQRDNGQVVFLRTSDFRLLVMNSWKEAEEFSR